jgi:hypothetical protein
MMVSRHNGYNETIKSIHSIIENLYIEIPRTNRIITNGSIVSYGDKFLTAKAEVMERKLFSPTTLGVIEYDIVANTTDIAVITGDVDEETFHVIMSYLMLALQLKPRKLQLLKLLKLYPAEEVVVITETGDIKLTELPEELLADIKGFRYRDLLVKERYACSPAKEDLIELAKALLF